MTEIQVLNPTAVPRVDCKQSGCKLEAEYTPKLIVRTHPLSVKQGHTCVSHLWLPLCKKHFFELQPRDFLCRDEVRQSIDEDFQLFGALPDFNKAFIIKLHKFSPEFKEMCLHAIRAAQRGRPM